MTDAGQEEAIQYQVKLWNSNYILILISSVLIFIGHQIFNPILPQYIGSLGISEGMTGSIISIAGISALVVRPFIGRALDTYGRKMVFLFGLLFFILSCLFYNLATILVLLFAIRIMHGISFGASTTSAATIAVDAMPKRDLAKGLIYYNYAPTISIAIAPALGFFIIGQLDYNYLFISASLVIALSLMLALFIKTGTALNSPSKDRSLFDKNAILPAAVVFFIVLSFSSVFFYISLYAAERGISNIGLFFIIYAVTIMVTRPIAAYLVESKDDDIIVIPSMFFFISGMLILAISDKLWLFIITAVMFGFGMGNIIPIMQSIALKNVPFNRRGAATSTFFNSIDVGVSIGPLAWGILAQLSSFSLMYLIASVPTVFAFILYIRLKRMKEGRLYY